MASYDNKFLNGNGLVYLWSKIKAQFASKTEVGNKIEKPADATAGNILAYNGTTWIASDAPEGGVIGFNGRAGTVMPIAGDYTAAMVGADAEGSAEDVQDNLDTHTGNDTIHVTASDKTTWSGKYSKPSGGIPYADLSTGVKGSLDKADSAMQPQTTLAGYGITDAKIQSGTITLGNTITPYVKPSTGIAYSDLASGVKSSLDKADSAVQPQTTLAGYGITDAKIQSGTITLGSNTITPVVDSDYVHISNNNQLTNGAGYQTASQVSSEITSAISGLTGFHFIIVQTLPTTDIETNAIYLLLKSSGSTGNIYTEYAYINSQWEILGDTQVDIEAITNAEIDIIVA